MIKKVCSKCRKELPYPESFFRDCTTKSGYKAYCKQCDYKIPRDRQVLKIKHTQYYKNKHAQYHKIYYARLRADSPEYRKWKANKDREYRQTPKGKARLVRQKARRKAREVNPTLTGEQWNAILQKFDNSCAYCGNQDNITMDHFVPLVLGGKTELGNIVPACIHCNSSKQHKQPNDWCNKEQL